MFFVARFVGGLSISRSHKGDANAPAPVQVIPAKKQRAALNMLEKQVFSDKPFHVPTRIYSYLGSSHWSHWGSNSSYRSEYPIHETIFNWQSRILSKLLSPLTMERIQDSELHTPADDDCFTNAELLERLTDMVFTEINDLKGEFTNRKPAISSLRRNLQRDYMKRLGNLALGNSYAPEDCQTLAYIELKELGNRIQKLLDSDQKLDDYSHAHLDETHSRITKILDSRMTEVSP
jgi:hypothetical protein